MAEILQMALKSIFWFFGCNSSCFQRIIKPDIVLERFLRELSDLFCHYSKMAEEFNMADVQFLPVLTIIAKRTKISLQPIK
jgi:hypothetical protein